MGLQKLSFVLMQDLQAKQIENLIILIIVSLLITQQNMVAQPIQQMLQAAVSSVIMQNPTEVQCILEPQNPVHLMKTPQRKMVEQ